MLFFHTNFKAIVEDPTVIIKCRTPIKVLYFYFNLRGKVFIVMNEINFGKSI
jgi:hypothetical protein